MLAELSGQLRMLPLPIDGAALAQSVAEARRRLDPR
jgi:hypothetical protein